MCEKVFGWYRLKTLFLVAKLKIRVFFLVGKGENESDLMLFRSVIKLGKAVCKLLCWVSI